MSVALTRGQLLCHPPPHNWRDQPIYRRALTHNDTVIQPYSDTVIQRYNYTAMQWHKMIQQYTILLSDTRWCIKQAKKNTLHCAVKILHTLNRFLKNCSEWLSCFFLSWFCWYLTNFTYKLVTALEMLSVLLLLSMWKSKGETESKNIEFTSTHLAHCTHFANLHTHTIQTIQITKMCAGQSRMGNGGIIR